MQFYKGNVKFDDLIIANLSLGFTRVIRNHQYFQLKSGVGRGLYLYIESNRNSKSTYIKRSFEVLRNKVPVEFKYPSDLKTKLKKSLHSMIENEIIKDYFYGDEILINGVKEQSIYIIFNGTRKQLIDSLTKKSKDIKNEKKEDLEVDYELKFPNDIKQELLDIGINSRKVADLIKRCSKWKLAEYILWIKDGIAKGKVKDPAGLFVFATEDDNVVVKKTHPQITEFIENIKSKVEGKKQVSKKLIDDAYKKYIDDALNLFAQEDEFAYEATKEKVLSDIEEVQSKRIKSQKQLYNMATTDEEKETLLLIIEKWEKFSTEREKSEIFIEQFVKKIKLYRKLKDYEEFKAEYIKNNQ